MRLGISRGADKALEVTPLFAQTKLFHRDADAMNRLMLCCVTAVMAGSAVAAAPPSSTKVKAVAEMQAAGTFDPKLTPTSAADAPVGAMSIAKTFKGDLDGTSVGQMLAMGNPAAGSAGYVAMERVTGTLGGRQGSFALQHSGTMDKGAQSLSVTVVPGTGTDGLAGLSGTMDIRIEGGQHFYILRYSLPG
jgi:hypothetical protein